MMDVLAAASRSGGGGSGWAMVDPDVKGKLPRAMRNDFA
jgi:hypothetical protein